MDNNTQMLATKLDTQEDLARENIDISRQLLYEIKRMNDSFVVHIEYLKSENKRIWDSVLENRDNIKEIYEKVNKLSHSAAPCTSYPQDVNNWFNSRVTRVVIFIASIVTTVLVTRWATVISKGLEYFPKMK